MKVLFTIELLYKDFNKVVYLEVLDNYQEFSAGDLNLRIGEIIKTYFNKENSPDGIQSKMQELGDSDISNFIINYYLNPKIPSS
jgi:hypothetical protein